MERFRGKILLGALVLLVVLTAVLLFTLAYLWILEGQGLHPSLASFSMRNVTIGKGSYRVFVADNEREYTEGLMNVSYQELQANDSVGMLFVFPSYGNQCFWMKNTKIPLLQAWISSNVISYEYNASPYSENVVCAGADAVLEIAGGSGNAPRVYQGENVSYSLT